MATITVIDQLYFQETGEMPSHYDRRWQARVSTNGDAPYLKRLRVGSEWQSIDLGWVDFVHTIRIENCEGTNLERALSATELDALEEKIVELSGGWLIHPGEIFRSRFQSGGGASSENVPKIRCLSQLGAMCSIIVIPV